MKRRLRKKKRVGEFEELSFLIVFRFLENLSQDARNKFLEDFIEHAIEDNGLVFGGGGAESEWEGVVSRSVRGSATENHRKAVEKWMMNSTFVESYYIGPLIGDWHFDIDFYPPEECFHVKEPSGNP